MSAAPTDFDLRAARRRLVVDAAGLSVSAIAFGLVYGLAARTAGFSLVEVVAMTVFALSGAAQFAAIGLVTGGVPWAAIVLLTALLNARHVLYSASLAPWLADRRRSVRAAVAYVLTDETFGVVLPHFRRLGRADLAGYGLATLFIVPTFLAANIVGYVGGQGVPDPTRFAIDIVFPAAMAGIAASLVSGRRELIAAVVGGLVAVGVGLVVGPSAGIVAGGLLAPAVALLIARSNPPTDVELAEEYAPGPIRHHADEPDARR